MKNIEREFPVNYNLDWCFGVEISKIREDLDAIEKLGATHVDIEACMEWDMTYVTLQVIDRRIETDSERDERMANELSRHNQQRDRELEQLKNLKEKYEQ